jgi:DNA-binding NarL/FixJ family response regulator
VASATIAPRPSHRGTYLTERDKRSRGLARSAGRSEEPAATAHQAVIASQGVRADNSRVDASRTRVVLADDDVLLREGLASLLDRSGLEVVGQAGDAAELIDVVKQQRPELAVIDIRMPPKQATEGLDAARVIQREFPETAVVVLSAHVEVEHAMDLLASGHRTGYLLKSRVTDVAEFIDALRRVVRGGSVVDPALVQELVTARRADDPLQVLTAREREVLALMAEGRSNAGIGQALWVTEGTVEKHVRSIMMKLELPETGEVHRRVLAVLLFLDTR